MKKIAVIPARYAATRFPAKLMQDLGGKPLIAQTYNSVINAGLFDDVFVATDSPIIYGVIKQEGGKVMMSEREHSSGSDRIAEAVSKIDCDIIINVQGDEPFIDKDSLKKLLNVFDKDPAKEIDLASLMTPIRNEEELKNPNNVKVITDINNMALYFSRAVIPYKRALDEDFKYMKHIGVYAFRKSALMDFARFKMHPLERCEKLEQLRFLEYGKKIKMVETPHQTIGIDTPEDLERARKIWK